ncbi:MAG: hypothetical protein OEU09_02265 [Rhodospirillales bacterium]|nr:hypothetical protein [Rhodospirillales bacterium]MDH3918241.1 hypothetical protein [Rhodospirillales bacterium]
MVTFSLLRLRRPELTGIGRQTIPSSSQHRSGHLVRRIARPFLFLACVAATATCASPPDELRWVESADAEEVFRSDVKAARFKFYGVYEYSLMFPGINEFNHSRCYRDIERVPIEGTSDALVSLEHLRLNRLASDFAEQYNLLMKDYLDREGIGPCSPAADWDGMLDALSEMVRGPTRSEGTAILTTSGAPGVSTESIRITLKDVSRWGEISSTTCKILAAHGIFDVVEVEVAGSLPGPGLPTRAIIEFRCANGGIER